MSERSRAVRSYQVKPGTTALDIDLRVGDVLEDADGVRWTVTGRTYLQFTVDRDPPSPSHHMTLPVRLISRS